MKITHSIKCFSAIFTFTILLGFGESSPPFRPRPGISTKPTFHLIHPFNDDRIVGGLEAIAHQFPYQASVHLKKSANLSSHFCGGSFLTPIYVVTAAHCVNGRFANKLLVLGGSNSFDQNSERISVSEITVHEDYDPDSVENDIALLKLEKPVTSGNISFVSLPEQQAEPKESAEAVVSGWGTIKEGDTTLPKILRYVGVIIINDTKCREQYGDSQIKDSMICAGFEEGGKDSCQGDSGGPLTLDNQLIGITSWGFGCARPNYAGVYTQVSNFVDWINERIRDPESV